MSHTCTAALVRCIDFRLEDAIHDHLSKEGLSGDIDIISVAGAAKNLNDGTQTFVADQLALSHKLHATTTVYLMNHTDCGGYGGRAAFESREAEHAHHADELTRAKARIEKELPNVDVKLLLADIQDDGSVIILHV